MAKVETVTTAKTVPMPHVDYDMTVDLLHKSLIDHMIAVREAEEAKRQFSREAVQWLVDRGMHEALKIDLGMLSRVVRQR